MATPSGVVQMLTSTTNKRRLNREARAALLRVRTGPECPEDNLRELMRDSNPNCGIARERGTKKEKENFHVKSSNLRHCQAHSQNKGLNEYQRRASWLQNSPFPVGGRRQVGDSQSWKGAILAPEMASSTKLQAGSQLITKSSWDPGRLTSAWRVVARDQLPRRDTRHT